MVIDVFVSADEFADPTNPEAIRAIDLEASRRSFERLLAAELAALFPTAEIGIYAASVGETSVYHGERVAWSHHPDAERVHVRTRSAIDKLFFYGRFWVNKRPGGAE